MYSIIVAFTQEVNPDWISKGVMFCLDQIYSHVMIIFVDIDGREKVFHCIGKGTCIDEDKAYLENHKIVKSFRIPMRCSPAEFSFWAKGRVGREYSDTQYLNIGVKFAVQWINRIFKTKFDIPVIFRNGAAKAICSEEVVAAAFMSDLEIPDNVELDLVDPEEVDVFLSRHKKAERIV